MSRWKALAAVRDIAPSELESRLTSALETLQLVADALGSEFSQVEPNEHGILEAISELQRDVEGAQKVIDEAQADTVAAEAAQAEAEAKLAAEPPDVAAFKKERDDAIAERDSLFQQLSAVGHLVESYSDALAHARRFVSVAEGAGLKTKHVRKARE